jgi:hypothetical protein
MASATSSGRSASRRDAGGALTQDGHASGCRGGGLDQQVEVALLDPAQLKVPHLDPDDLAEVFWHRNTERDRVDEVGG